MALLRIEKRVPDDREGAKRRHVEILHRLPLDDADTAQTAVGAAEVDIYMDAQNALALYHEQPWFNELDELFASSIRELAYPELVTAAAIVSEARQRDTASYIQAEANGEIGQENCRDLIAEMRHRVEATKLLMTERQKAIYVYTLGVETMQWNALTALLACERLVQQNLAVNLALYEERVAQLFAYGKRNGWWTD